MCLRSVDNIGSLTDYQGVEPLCVFVLGFARNKGNNRGLIGVVQRVGGSLGVKRSEIKLIKVKFD